MKETHKTVKSPHPGLRGLEVYVPEVNFASCGGRLPNEGTLYGSSEWKTFFGADYRKEFSNFIYNGQGDDNNEGGSLLFSPNRTPVEIQTPFRTTEDYSDFYWDTILLALIFIKDPLPRSTSIVNNNGIGVIIGDRYRVREVYIPGGEIGSIFRTDEFLSPTRAPVDSTRFSSTPSRETS